MDIIFARGPTAAATSGSSVEATHQSLHVGSVPENYIGDFDEERGARLWRIVIAWS